MVSKEVSLGKVIAIEGEENIKKKGEEGAE